MEKKTLVLIDSNAIIHRAYHALPKTMSTRKGELTNVVYGYTTTLIKVLEDLKPDYIAASFDVSKNTFRLAEYAEYKAHRVKADQELYDQIPRVKQLLNVLSVPIYELEGFEADDVIGTIAHICQESGVGGQENGSKLQTPNSLHIYIVTGDKDAFQLVDGNIEVYDLKHGLSDAQIVNSTVIKTLWNLDPYDFIDLKALAGDPSDNIPGVPGIGPKTATLLLQKYDTLVDIYKRIDEGLELDVKPRILGLLKEYKEQAFLSQRLATIRKDVPLDFKLEDCQWGDYDKDSVRDFFEEMQFNSLLRRFGAIKGDMPKTEQSKEQKKQDDQLKLL
ncbi:MAG: 5'-3' exonuclease H3TH domain-containing protein [Patescibacteria group bacterium]|jgi:DNA polymerase-1